VKVGISNAFARSENLDGRPKIYPAPNDLLCVPTRTAPKSLRAVTRIPLIAYIGAPRQSLQPLEK
jgi:hypothetical protein